MATNAELRAMRRAIGLAARGGTHPNPCVAAVALDATGAEIGQGVTDPWPGRNHAEVNALIAVDEVDTLVVTLEPCDHVGRSPACTELIVERGVRRVVVGSLDPDDRASGRGIERLRAAGIEVETGVMAEAVEALDPAYFHHRRTGRPYFTLKTALTLDGQTGARDGTSQWITGEEARHDSHRLRAQSDAVMIGAGTLRTDDPELTARVEGVTHQPIGVVVAGKESLPPARKLWAREGTLVISSRPIPVDVDTEIVAAADDGWPLPMAIAGALGRRDIVSVLIEGGSLLASAFWHAGLIDRGVNYVGARMAGGVGSTMLAGEWSTFAESQSTRVDSVRQLGDDVKIEWRPGAQSSGVD